METIASIKYNDERHTIKSFLKDNVKPFIIHLINPKIVEDLADGKNIVELIEKLITMRWTTMLSSPNHLTGQVFQLQLEENKSMEIHLLINGKKDRMVLALYGKNKVLHLINIGFVGDENTFKDYIGKLNISEFEFIQNAVHYES